MRDRQSIAALLNELKAGFIHIYGPRLRGVFLYGSYARNEADADSDVDVVVVLDAIDRYYDEIRRTGDLASRLSLKHGVSVSRAFLTEADWRDGRSPFLINAREEAIPA
ncbi:MAG TPA: nucleotidyltransferase domain-containing protein [Vicinamibacteria bacterium]|jgi:predicted nucleotidyltransferase|nr:nucleotidyltransferase domain-containing protein [Vicinamibacteria bacterium]